MGFFTGFHRTLRDKIKQLKKGNFLANYLLVESTGILSCFDQSAFSSHLFHTLFKCGFVPCGICLTNMLKKMFLSAHGKQGNARRKMDSGDILQEHVIKNDKRACAGFHAGLELNSLTWLIIYLLHWAPETFIFSPMFATTLGCWYLPPKTNPTQQS